MNRTEQPTDPLDTSRHLVGDSITQSIHVARARITNPSDTDTPPRYAETPFTTYTDDSDASAEILHVGGRSSRPDHFRSMWRNIMNAQALGLTLELDPSRNNEPAPPEILEQVEDMGNPVVISVKALYEAAQRVTLPGDDTGKEQANETDNQEEPYIAAKSPGPLYSKLEGYANTLADGSSNDRILRVMTLGRPFQGYVAVTRTPLTEHIGHPDTENTSGEPSSPYMEQLTGALLAARTHKTKTETARRLTRENKVLRNALKDHPEVYNAAIEHEQAAAMTINAGTRTYELGFENSTSKPHLVVRAVAQAIDILSIIKKKQEAENPDNEATIARDRLRELIGFFAETAYTTPDAERLVKGAPQDIAEQAIQLLEFIQVGIAGDRTDQHDMLDSNPDEIDAESIMTVDGDMITVRPALDALDITRHTERTRLVATTESISPKDAYIQPFDDDSDTARNRDLDREPHELTDAEILSIQSFLNEEHHSNTEQTVINALTAAASTRHAGRYLELTRERLNRKKVLELARWSMSSASLAEAIKGRVMWGGLKHLPNRHIQYVAGQRSDDNSHGDTGPLFTLYRR